MSTTTLDPSPFLRADAQSNYNRTFVERVMLAAPAEVAGRVVRRPLTEEQAGILRSIADKPYPGYGWTWSNDSATRRLLDALVKKGLVVEQEGGTYRAKAFVSDALRAIEQERQAERAARDDAEAQRNQAKYDGLVADLQADQAVLYRALLAAKDAGTIDEMQYTRAYNRVGALKVQTWAGSWPSA